MMYLYLVISLFSLVYITGQSVALLANSIVLNGVNGDRLKKNATLHISLWGMIGFAISTSLFVYEVMK